MKRGLTSLLFIIPLLGAVMLFHACPFGFPRAKAEEVSYQKPTWAVNKPGTIELDIEGIEPPIEYNPNMTYRENCTLKAKSTVYTGDERVYGVSYEISYSFKYLGNSSKNIGEADYSSGELSPNETDITNFELIIPKGYEAIQNVKISIKYNITNLMTKIHIPMDIKKPPSGQSSTMEFPIFYSASPIIPKTDKAQVTILSRKVVISFNLTDAVGCLSEYKGKQYVNYRVELYGGIGQGGEKRKIENISCTPSSPIQLSPNVQIKCTIDLEKDPEIYQIFSSVGAHLELYMYIGPYSCSLKKEKIIPVTIIT